jgi:hypothetical protein
MGNGTAVQNPNQTLGNPIPQVFVDYALFVNLPLVGWHPSICHRVDPSAFGFSHPLPLSYLLFSKSS